MRTGHIFLIHTKGQYGPVLILVQGQGRCLTVFFIARVLHRAWGSGDIQHMFVSMKIFKASEFKIIYACFISLYFLEIILHILMEKSYIQS